MNTPLSEIQLRLISETPASHSVDFVVFQKNEASGSTENPIAWIVVEQLGLNDIHPFDYQFNMEVDAIDEYSNYTPRLPAVNGEGFRMIESPSGHELVKGSNAPQDNEVSLQNALSRGAIVANIYRGGNLLASQIGVAAGSTALFSFVPKIYIGAAKRIQVGQILPESILTDISTMLDLTGLASADIVVKGGGTGPQAQPYSFTLTNVKPRLN